MTVAQRVARSVAAAAVLATIMATPACQSTGGLGNILGGVLSPQPTAVQLAGTIQGVDTRNTRIAIQQTNGQSLQVLYDNRTKVVYQNQAYPVTSLEFGDQVIARLQDQGNNTYYTDSVYVTQPVNANTGATAGTGSTANMQSLQGNVRQIDRAAGWFTIDASNNVTLTVTLPYRANSQDVNKFNNLRAGDVVRFYGVFLNSSRVELRQFY